jgi:endonuclease III-like uncharacterized protein
MNVSEKILANWEALNQGLKNLKEDDLLYLLQKEKKGKRRLQFLIRIYGSYNKLRTRRERSELAGVK